jgi:hypothetical protein
MPTFAAAWIFFLVKYPTNDRHKELGLRAQGFPSSLRDARYCWLQLPAHGAHSESSLLNERMKYEV